MAVDYVFTRDFLDNNRLNLQHYLWVELFGYLLHPAIATKNNPHLRVADVGTGTAVWLLDLAKRVPVSVSLDGLDVSFNATPPPEWLPTNVTLREYDVFSAVPDDLVSAYDVVHIRNFAFVLKDTDMKAAMDNLTKLLKPGGYLQWAEPDVASFRIEKSRTENKTDALAELLSISQPQDARLSPHWVPKLPTLFRDAGLGQVQYDVKDAPSDMAMAMHECGLAIHELLAQKTGNVAVRDGLNRILPEVARETRDGSVWAFTRWTVVGRKAAK